MTIEDPLARQVADEMIMRLPPTPAEFEKFLDRGHALAEQMSWDVVAQNYVVPGIKRATLKSHLKKTA